MNRISKLAFVAVSALVITSSSQAGNGELIVGFTGGSSDFLYDLGAYTSLVSGMTWSLGASRGNGFGVVGYQTTGRHIYATSSDSAENGYVLTAGSGAFNPIRADMDAIFGTLTSGMSRTTTPSDQSGWTYNCAQPFGTPGGILQNDLFYTPNVDASTKAYFFDNAGGSAAFPKGYFTYNSGSGVLTYTLAAAPPPPVRLTISRSGTLSTISFPSTNGVTYTLCYTNSAGLTTSATNWPFLPGTISGDNTVKSFQDTTTDPMRLYEVKEQ